MQSGDLVARIPHVATHRGVGPLARAVAVEAQVKLGELPHVVDNFIGVAQRGESLAHHARAHDLVVMEGHASVALEATSLGLADVVQQRGEPQHEIGTRGRLVRGLQVDRLLHHDERVLVDILVAVMLIDLKLQAGELRQDVRREAGLDEDRETQTWACSEEKLAQFIANALRGHDL